MRDCACSRESTESHVKVQLDRISAQIDGLQQRVDVFIARRNEAIAERASQRVASIVAAAERSAAEIKARAENDAAGIRERLLADVEAEVEVVRSTAHADAARICAEAHAQVERARNKAVTEARAEIQEVCSKLSDELRRGARTAIARIRGRAQAPLSAAPTPRVAVSTSDPLRQPAVEVGGRGQAQQISREVAAAVGELECAATVLERSLRDSRGGGTDEPQRTAASQRPDTSGSNYR
jgi:hypothetical protein